MIRISVGIEDPDDLIADLEQASQRYERTHQRMVLASRPQGGVSVDNFRRVPIPTPAPAVLVRNHYLSLDPYMRGRMEESRSYADPQRLDETMVGGTVGVVAVSNHPSLAVGDCVVGQLGWQEYGVTDGTALRKVDTSRVPMSAYLGPVGMPGVTAWFGLNKLCEPKAGETVLVSAASGAVGSVVGQLARQAGCRAVGIAGGAEKCRYVIGELSFDACLDHLQPTDMP
jgi:NADPH-dependent curcumin reductase CurA